MLPSQSYTLTLVLIGITIPLFAKNLIGTLIFQKDVPMLAAVRRSIIVQGKLSIQLVLWMYLLLASCIRRKAAALTTELVIVAVEGETMVAESVELLPTICAMVTGVNMTVEAMAG